MTLQAEIWQLLGFLGMLSGMFVAAIWGIGKVMLRQFSANLDTRFQVMEKSREEGRQQWSDRFERIELSQGRVDRDLLTLRAELPEKYVRREDAIRSETVINAKLDSLAAKIDLVASRQRQE